MSLASDSDETIPQGGNVAPPCFRSLLTSVSRVDAASRQESLLSQDIPVSRDTPTPCKQALKGRTCSLPPLHHGGKIYVQGLV